MAVGRSHLLEDEQRSSEHTQLKKDERPPPPHVVFPGSVPAQSLLFFLLSRVGTTL